MKLENYNFTYPLIILTLLLIITTENQKVYGEIIPDHTLSGGNSLVTPIDSLTDKITGGTTTGMNLFHSFDKFNIDVGKTVYFANPHGIENILTRVTGSNPSNILGKLGVDGTANLYLINPNGIYFGNGAILDIKGSFIATTADEIKLGNSGLFSAKNPQDSNLLNIQPSALFINSLRNQQAIIKNQGNLEVVNGKNITLFSSNLESTGKLSAPEGKIALTGIENLIVRGDINIGNTGTLLLETKNLNLGTDNNATIHQNTLEGLSGNTNLIFLGTNDITVNPLNNQTLNLANGSGKITFTADADNNGIGNWQMNYGDTIKTNGRSIDIQGINLTIGNINVSSTLGGGNINLTAENNITTQSLSTFNIKNGHGNAGNINIKTGALLVSNNSYLDASTYGQGNGGIINIHAADTVQIDNNSYVESDVAKGAVGKAGGVNITTKYLKLLNSSWLTTNIFGQGDAGNITITATDTVTLDGRSGIESAIAPGAAGQSGSINISTKSLEVLGVSRLRVNTYGRGNAGSVKINASDLVKFDRQSSAISRVQTTGVGNAGDVDITTKVLQLEGGSFLSASTFGKGNAGTVKITASDSIRFDGQSAANSTVQPGAIGNAGDVDITTKSLEILGGSFVSASTFGKGDAGSILITAENLNIGDSAKISASTSSNGQGGNIYVDTNTLTATNGGQILTTTSGIGKAGNMLIIAQDNITLDGDQTGLFANTGKGSTGDSGSIEVKPQLLIIKNGAGIGVNSQGMGKGGNISIDSDTLLLNNNAVINAATATNQGGEINLQVKDLLWLRNHSNITATAGTADAGGNGGNITINTPFIIGFAKENSDITANAFQGNGGNINITANAIFGLKFRRQQTEFSDITASSQFGLSGQVTINRLNVDPVRGLIALPTNFVDTNNKFSQSCGSRGSRLARQKNRFTITGKGGLPSHPYNLLNGMSPLVNLVEMQPTKISLPSVKSVVINPQKVNIKNREITQKIRKIQQIQGWIFTDDGKVILTAQTPHLTMENSTINYPNCDTPVSQ